MKRNSSLLGAVASALILPATPAHSQAKPAQNATTPQCIADSSYQRLAFWVGDWDVFDSTGAKYATQRVRAVIDECAITAEWASGGGNKGLGLSAFDMKTRAWKQVYVSNQVPFRSGVTIRTSDPSYAGPGIRFVSVSDPAAESSVQNRVTILPLSDHRALQQFEESRDGGKTWKVVFKAEHRPRPDASGTSSVVPGLSVHVAEQRDVDTVIYQRSITRAGRDSMAGTRTVVSHIVKGADEAQLLEIEQRFPGGGGEIVDTAIAELRTLRAVAHRSHQPTRTMRFDFVGNDAEGTVREKAEATQSSPAPQTIHQSLGGPIFDSNVIDLVVSALPLERGFRASLPFFIYERGGRVVMPVEVRDRGTRTFGRLGERDAWVVSVDVPGAPATVWVDTKTRAVLRVRYDIAARSLSFTDERVTELRGQI
ncbi:MAG TPA: hypothetical protein VJ825_11310 [Gemmatimonadaceae bacterium]|nr:hypothetical protein [Gemmatimonadaceae bacterium]